MTTLKPIRRRAAAVSAPLLLALSLTACGGDDASSAPEDASSEEFCKVFLDQDTEIDSEDTDAQLKAAQEVADQLSEVGTPADFTDEERDGFEVLIEFINDLDADDVEEFTNADDPSEVLDEDDAAKVTAFTAAAAEACIGDLGGDLGGDLEDQLGDELPSDFPS